jgi:lysozyme family protein
MAQFSLVENNLLHDEGTTLVNTKGDRGGLTKYGISQSAYPLLDIAALTATAAEAIYERDWWNKYNLSSIISQSIANKLFLGMINTGANATIRCLQQALNAVNVQVDVDGDLGNETIAAINSAQPQGWLLDRLRVELAMYYASLVERDAPDLQFLDGWDFRALQ